MTLAQVLVQEALETGMELAWVLALALALAWAWEKEREQALVKEWVQGLAQALELGQELVQVLALAQELVRVLVLLGLEMQQAGTPEHWKHQLVPRPGRR